MKKVIVLLIIVSFTFMGCWDSVETEELGLVKVIGLGKGKNDDVRVIIQEIPHEKRTTSNQGASGGGKNSFHLYSSTGTTISEAIQSMSASEHHKLYFAHTKVVVLDEALVSSKGIKPVIDFFERNPELRLSTWILIAPMKQFDEILTKNVGIGLDTGGILDETIHNKKEKSFLAISNLGSFIELFNKSGSEAYAAGVNTTAKDSLNETIKSNQKFYVRDTAVFKDDKMIGWLTEKEYKGFSWVNGYSKGAIINIPFGDEVISLRIVRVKSKLEPIIDDGKMKININVKILSNIEESQANYNFMNEDIIKKAEELQNQKIKSEIIAALEKSRRLGSDVFGIGNYFNMKYPGFWKKVESNWNSYYPEVNVNINVDSTIKNIGNIYKFLKR